MNKPSLFAQDVRGVLTRAIAEMGFAPDLSELAQRCACSESQAAEALRELADAHALLLHPATTQPWVVHPFALMAGPCWVETVARSYWANCVYCALGIAACTQSDCSITTRYGGEGETLVLHVRAGELIEQEGVFHLSIPVAQWWDNVVAACFSFQLFKNEAQVNDWCQRHRMAKGAILSLPQLWAFASDWYGNYLHSPWRKRSRADILALFARHQLSGPFWALPEH